MNERPDNVSEHAGSESKQAPQNSDKSSTAAELTSTDTTQQESNPAVVQTAEDIADNNTDSNAEDAPASTDNNMKDVNETSTAAVPAQRKGLRRKIVLIAAAATIGVLAVGGGTAAAMAKNVTLVVDGQSREITTLAGSVEGALSSAGLQTGAHDVLAPAADTAISDGSQIALERGRLLSLTINGQQKQIWTTADTVEDALVQLGQDPSALSLSADRSREIPLEGLAVTADALRSVTLSDGGAPATPVQTAASTVADVLADQNITLAATDVVTPALTTAVTDGLQISVTRVSVTTVTDTVDVPPTDVQSDDPAIDKGTTVVAVAGTPGKLQVVNQVTSTNGVETARQEVSRTTVTEATPNQVHVGTKSSLDVQGSRVFFHDTEFGVNWDGLAFCESTNNPHAVNNPSGFLSTYGLFQFDLPTWASVGGAGNPGDATPEEQLVRAKLLFQSRGLEPWLCGYAASGPPAG